MICTNCGFRNQPGDEFCGSCGQFLEWTGQPSPADDAEATTVGQPPAIPPDTAPVAPPVTIPTPPLKPPSAPPRYDAPPPQPPPSSSPTWPARPSSTAPITHAPDVICWNCATRNPASRRFCIKCGERLQTDRPAAAAASGGGGGPNRLLPVAIGAIVLLVLAGVIAFALLGGNPSPTATPTLIAGITATPGVETPSAQISPSPSVLSTTPALITPTPLVTDSPPPPTPPRTPRPTRRPTQPPPPPTPSPTPLNCAAPASSTRSLTLDQENSMRTLGTSRGWCIRGVTFTNTTIAGASVRLKLYLINEQVFSDLADYTYGWLEVLVDQPGEYTPDFYYPPSYMENGLLPNTAIVFAVEECTAAPGFCDGRVVIEYEPGPAPQP